MVLSDWLQSSLVASVAILLLDRLVTKKKRNAEYKGLLIKNEKELEDFKNVKITELTKEAEVLKKTVRDMTERYSKNVDLFIQKIREVENSNAKLISMIRVNAQTIAELKRTIEEIKNGDSQ